MAGPVIVYVPGLFGSEIGIPANIMGGGFPVIWGGAGAALTGQLLQLQLAADGVSPGPLTFGFNYQATAIWQWTYAPLAAWMAGRGWTVLTVPFDWRLSAQVSGAQLLATIKANLGSTPFVFVAHSQGGIIARAAYALMLTAGTAGQCLGMVTMGTPHFGSWAIVRAFFGIEPFYNQIQHLAGLIGPFVPGYRQDFLDVIAASWPGFYELLPWRDSGPLFISDPATAASLYQAATYAGGNPYVSQARFNAAAFTQDFLAPAIPLNKIVCIRGIGYRTAYEVNPGVSLGQDAGYLYNGAGDGTVPTSYATVLTATNIDLPFPHGQLPLEWRVWNAIRWAVSTFVGQGA